MSIGEALDVSRVYAVTDLLPSDLPLVRTRLFCSPHHTISNAGTPNSPTPPSKPSASGSPSSIWTH